MKKTERKCTKHLVDKAREIYNNNKSKDLNSESMVNHNLSLFSKLLKKCYENYHNNMSCPYTNRNNSLNMLFYTYTNADCLNNKSNELSL